MWLRVVGGWHVSTSVVFSPLVLVVKSSFNNNNNISVAAAMANIMRRMAWRKHVAGGAANKRLALNGGNGVAYSETETSVADHG